VKTSAVVFLFFLVFLFLKLVSSRHYDFLFLHTVVYDFFMILRLSFELMTLIDINKLSIHLYF